MGRSQVKYRTTHGRGRGRGRGRGYSADGRTGASKRKQPFHLRNLDSNAYRFEEHEAQDDEHVTDQPSQSRRTQFFASEQQYRETMGCTSGEYFQSRVMKQWEEKDDAADDNKAVEMLDLSWIAAQLEFVPPKIRYRMRPEILY
ncbi:unnamed protein product [Peronospora destructor]|uniref:Btz domain-containing protein n=1 Tax=Peronospora destructor TaxID=86335 RepID=A0AAV0UX36_9STRA|nr:unnamed protein product [Peronospora destructor]